ncbi:MAG: hypothetical protein SGJ27_13120 [Candidatus Melainabacteria bacterium]|nr:hypothetical protein [Candidatus Melainabacteria bacterium]
MSTNGDCLAGNEIGTAAPDATGAANFVQDLWKPASGSTLKVSEQSSDTKFSFGLSDEFTIPPLNEFDWKNSLSKDLGSPSAATTSDNQPLSGKNASPTEAPQTSEAPKSSEAPQSSEPPKSSEAPKQLAKEQSLLDAFWKNFDKGASDATSARNDKHAENAENNDKDPEAQLKKQAAQIARYIGDGSLGKNPYQRRVIGDILAKATDGGEEHFNKLVEQINEDLKERNSPMHLDGKFSMIDENFTYVGKDDVHYPNGKDFKMPSSKLALVDTASGEKQDELNNIVIRNPEDWVSSGDPSLRARKMDPIDFGTSHKNVIEPPESQGQPIDTGLPPLESDLPQEKRAKLPPLKTKR